MARLKTLLDGLDDLDEAYHDLYEQNEHGEYVLQIDGVDRHPTVRGLRAALDTAKQQRQAARAQLAHFQPLLDALGEDDDVDATVHDLLARMGDNGDGEADIEARIEARMNAVAAKHQRELSKAQERAGSLESALSAQLVDAGLDRNLEKVGVLKELRAAARAMLKQRGVKTLELGEGEFRAVFPTDIHDVPEANQPLDEYVEAWAKTEDAQPFLAASGSEGSGSPPGRRSEGTGGQKRYTKSQLQSGNFDLDAVADGKASVVG